MANYVVILRFDEKTDGKLFALRRLLEDAGYSLSEWPPHITIAAYENLNESLLCEWVSKFSSNHKKIKITVQALSILPPSKTHKETAVLCVSPSYSRTFIDFYYGFHAKYEEYCTGIGILNSISHDNPVIHATIGIFKTDEIQKAMDIIFQSDIFGDIEINALEVYTYPMKLIKRYDLK